jgi:hypothetical protein
MAQVACFCGCCFSFDGGAGTCPKCGEAALLRGGAGPEIKVFDWTDEPPAAGARQGELPALAWPDVLDALPGLAMDVIARGR